MVWGEGVVEGEEGEGSVVWGEGLVEGDEGERGGLRCQADFFMPGNVYHRLPASILFTH